MNFNISTYKNYRVFYKGDEVEVVDSCFRNKVVICNEDNLCTLVDPSELEMRLLLANFIHLHVNIYYKLEKYQGIALDISDNMIVYINKEGHLQRSFLGDLRLMSDIESFDASLIKHNLYWDGSALKPFIKDDWNRSGDGLVIKESNRDTKTLARLSTLYESRADVFHVGERVHIFHAHMTDSGVYYAVSHEDKTGWIFEANIAEELMEPYAQIQFNDGTQIEGYILDASLPHITYIDCTTGEKMASEVATNYTIRESVYNRFLQCNHVCKGNECIRVITSCYGIHKKIKVTKCVKASTFIEVGLACGIKTLPDVGIEGETTNILQDYKGNLYYIMESNDSLYLVSVLSTEEIK